MNAYRKAHGRDSPLAYVVLVDTRVRGWVRVRVRVRNRVRV